MTQFSSLSSAAPRTFCVPVIGDAHFKQDARQPDRLAAVDQILRENLDRQVGLWAIPGDLYDAGSDIGSRNDWIDRIEAMAQRAPVVICYGNHDRDGDLYVLGKVRQAFPVHVLSSPKVLDVMTPMGVVVSVFVLPYPFPAGLVAAGTPPADVVATARAMLDAIFMDASARLEAARKAGRPTLFIGHANVGGSKMSTGQPLIGHEIELDANLLLRVGDAPKVLNHIHLPQEIDGAVLTGSVTAMSWGETERKRYVRIDYTQAGEGLSALFADWSWTVHSCPLRTPALVHVNATFADLSLTYDIPPHEVAAGSDVRVRVRFPETERQFFEHGRVQVTQAFAHARKLQIEPVCEADRGLRAPDVAFAVTLLEKIKAWCAANNEPVPTGLDDALGALETRPAEDVIAEFKTRMTVAMDV